MKISTGFWPWLISASRPSIANLLASKDSTNTCPLVQILSYNANMDEDMDLPPSAVQISPGGQQPEKLLASTIGEAKQKFGTQVMEALTNRFNHNKFRNQVQVRWASPLLGLEANFGPSKGKCCFHSLRRIRLLCSDANWWRQVSDISTTCDYSRGNHDCHQSFDRYASLGKSWLPVRLTFAPYCTKLQLALMVRFHANLSLW